MLPRPDLLLIQLFRGRNDALADLLKILVSLSALNLRGLQPRIKSRGLRNRVLIARHTASAPNEQANRADSGNGFENSGGMVHDFAPIKSDQRSLPVGHETCNIEVNEFVGVKNAKPDSTPRPVPLIPAPRPGSTPRLSRPHSCRWQHFCRSHQSCASS